MPLTLPYPPSVNHYWRRVGLHTLISREGRTFRQNVCALLGGGGNQMADLLAQAQEMQNRLLAAQQEIAATEVTGTAGNGLVTITGTGTGDVTAVTISPDVVDPDDVETLQDLLVGALADLAASRDALTGLRESLSVDMASVLRTAKQAARDEASVMGEALASRIEALESDHLDPDALAEQVREALLPSLSDGEAALKTAKQALAGLAERITTGDFEDAMTKLRSDLTQEILRGVPKAAAAVIREEIAALIKEFGR